MDISGMNIVSIDDNTSNLLIIEALEAGVTDFLSKPIHTVMFKAR